MDTYTFECPTAAMAADFQSAVEDVRPWRAVGEAVQRHRVVDVKGCPAIGLARLRKLAERYGAKEHKIKKESGDARTPTTTYDDGSFVRTALVIGPDGESGSVDVVDHKGQRIAQINIFWQEAHGEGPAHLMVDVIDVDKRFAAKRALVFSPTERGSLDVPKGGNLVGVDFRSEPKEDSHG